MIEIDIIIEAFIDNRTDSHFRLRPQLFDGVSEQVRAGMANNFQPRLIFGGNDGKLSIVLNDINGINQFPINADGNAGFGQTRTDIAGNIKGRDRMGKLTLTAIRESYNRHASFLKLQW